MNSASVAFDRPEASNPAADVASMTNVTERMLSDIRALAPEITARAAEIEAGRRIPPDLVDKLRSIGIFRALTPRSHGGLEIDLPPAIQIMEALCRIEGSIGWITMIGMGTAIFAPLLPREVYEQIYQNGPDVVFASSIQPAGTAEATAGGWRVGGRWPFSSGCQHAGWIFALCVMSKDGKPIPETSAEDSPPMIRCFVLPASEWQIEDTWYVAGLQGTGSHHVSLKDKVVPEANFFDLMTSRSCIPGPLYQGLRQIIPLMHFPAALGIAEGALNDLVGLANTGRQQQRATVAMRNSEIFQYELGRIEAEFRAARAYADAQTESHWRHALAGTLNTEALFTQSAQAVTWITASCVRIVDACFSLGGGSAVYDTSPLQRRMRDLHVAAQHAAVHPRIYAAAGKLLLDSARVTPSVRAA
jgi:indole-3-acetate monooxygenase